MELAVTSHGTHEVPECPLQAPKCPLGTFYRLINHCPALLGKAQWMAPWGVDGS